MLQPLYDTDEDTDDTFIVKDADSVGEIEVEKVYNAEPEPDIDLLWSEVDEHEIKEDQKKEETKRTGQTMKTIEDDIVDSCCVADTLFYVKLYELRKILKNGDKNERTQAKFRILGGLKGKLSDQSYKNIEQILENYFQ